MRSTLLKSALHLAAAAGLSIAVSACGGGSSNPFNPNPNGNGYGSQCAPGTNVQLANPSTYASGVPTNIGAITIVADGSSNSLYNTYNSWNLVLQGSFGNTITSGQLGLVSDANGPHPFPSDYYYSGSVPTLPAGQTFQVLLENNTGFCSPVTIGQFST